MAATPKEKPELLTAEDLLGCTAKVFVANW